MLASLLFVTNVASVVLIDLIKEVVINKYKENQQAENAVPESEIEIREIEQPDGSKLVVVVLKQ